MAEAPKPEMGGRYQPTFWTREGWLYLGLLILDFAFPSYHRLGGQQPHEARFWAVRALNMAHRIPVRHQRAASITRIVAANIVLTTIRRSCVNMGSKCRCLGRAIVYDNAAVETFFKTIKAELIWRRSWETRRQAEMAIFEYINGFYNPRRRHSALGWKSPVAFERKALKRALGAAQKRDRSSVICRVVVGHRCSADRVRCGIDGCRA